MDILIYIVLVILVLTILYGVYLLARVVPEWLKVPGTPDWIHKGGGRVVVNQDNDPREQFVSMTCKTRKDLKRGIFILDASENLGDAQAIVELHYDLNRRAFLRKFKWLIILAAYIGASISYYLTLLASLPIESMSVEELGWYRYGALAVIILVLPGLIIWGKREELKLLWKGENKLT